jgi:lauroyl/myristoyl acyltransferase
VGDNRARRLLRTVKRAAYLAAVAPAVGRLPAALSYRMACWRGDWHFRCQAGKRTEMARNLRLVLGDELRPAAAQQVTREWFRLSSCGAVDVMRLRRGPQPLRRLVEIRGREHLEAALAAGKGALVCTGHFHSHDSGFSVLHASGFPVTTIGRRGYNYDAGISSAERWLWELYFRPMRRYRQRPAIEPWPGRPQVAALAAAALRANEVVRVTIDAPPLDSDRARAVEVPFLGRHAGLLPGAVALAQVTGAPLLMGIAHRAADYRHQVLEISAPVPVDGDIESVFERCAAEVSAAIRRSPASWGFWPETGDLVAMGLIRPPRDGSPAAGAVPQPPGNSCMMDQQIALRLRAVALRLLPAERDRVVGPLDVDLVPEREHDQHPKVAPAHGRIAGPECL